MSDPRFRSSLAAIQPEWIDLNGHLNVAYYHVLFDRALDELLSSLGMRAEFVRDRGMTTFVAEAHSRYVREVPPDSRVFTLAQIIEHDEKRIHLFQELYHSDGWLAATLETLILSIDAKGPRVAPFVPEIAERIAALSREHAVLPRPEAAGGSVGLKRRR